MAAQGKSPAGRKNTHVIHTVFRLVNPRDPYQGYPLRYKYKKLVKSGYIRRVPHAGKSAVLPTNYLRVRVMMNGMVSYSWRSLSAKRRAKLANAIIEGLIGSHDNIKESLRSLGAEGREKIKLKGRAREKGKEHTDSIEAMLEHIISHIQSRICFLW